MVTCSSSGSSRRILLNESLATSLNKSAYIYSFRKANCISLTKLRRFALFLLSEKRMASWAPTTDGELNIPESTFNWELRIFRSVADHDVHSEIENAGVIRRIRIAQVVIVYADNILIAVASSHSFSYSALYMTYPLNRIRTSAPFSSVKKPSS